jgi:hypothetical protein
MRARRESSAVDCTQIIGWMIDWCTYCCCTYLRALRFTLRWFSSHYKHNFDSGPLYLQICTTTYIEFSFANINILLARIDVTTGILIEIKHLWNVKMQNQVNTDTGFEQSLSFPLRLQTDPDPEAGGTNCSETLVIIYQSTRRCITEVWIQILNRS